MKNSKKQNKKGEIKIYENRRNKVIKNKMKKKQKNQEEITLKIKKN